MYPVSASVGPSTLVRQEPHKILFNLWFAISGGTYQATNPATPFWLVCGHYKIKEGLFPLHFASNPLISTVPLMALEWQSSQCSPRLASKAQKCHRVVEEEGRVCPWIGSERSLPLGGHRTGQKSDPNGTLPSTFFASQSFGNVPRPNLHVCLCGQVRPSLLFVFPTNTNLSH